MNRPVSVGLLGLGAVVRRIHMPAYARLGKQVRVIAGCDPDRAAREHASSRWGIPVFPTRQEMLDAVRPDVIAVCTPPRLHRDDVLFALEHGCHVFCEKPVAEDLRQADEMIEAGRRARRLVVVNSEYPFMNIHAAAKRLIGSPRFGRLLYVHVWHVMRTSEQTEAGWRGGLSRRLCFEFGTHVFELVRFFFESSPDKVLAHMPNPLGRFRCDTVNVIPLEFADGRGASIVLERLTRGPDRYLEMRLVGEHAVIRTSIGGRVRVAAGLRTPSKRPYLEVTLARGGRAVLEDAVGARVLATEGGNPFADATSRLFAGFLRAIGEGGEPPGSIRDNRETLALVMAAYESAESGNWVHTRRAPRPVAVGEG